jgi:hypothetical protein
MDIGSVPASDRLTRRPGRLPSFAASISNDSNARKRACQQLGYSPFGLSGKALICEKGLSEEAKRPERKGRSFQDQLLSLRKRPY